ncbi:hypothetical protein, partial [Halorhodospira halophila]|uniref:hypothetical protein n=1 Tax=Halorhodospira halophila TaxID=1053 RepID=UPI001A917640
GEGAQEVRKGRGCALSAFDAGAEPLHICHGLEGFRTFSNEKAVPRKGRWNSAPCAGPPYGGRVHRWVHRLMVR